VGGDTVYKLSARVEAIVRAAKADGRFNACQLRETVNFLNESTTDVETLRENGINSRAADNIVAHRNGPDEQFGTGDDDLFDDLGELDAIAFVGPVTLGQVVSTITERCFDDLDSRPIIDSTTFDSSTGGGFTRDNVELEAAMTLNGITGAKLHEVLTSTDSRDRTIFSRIRKNKKMEGFTFNYDIDEVPWNSEAMDAREALPYVALSIESGRFEQEDGGERELSLGTDVMDDTYYDTREFALLDHDMVVRGRVRWDTDTEVRRLLIAAKFGSNVNDEGLKQAAKVDVRTEGGRHMATLDRDVMSGTVPWSGRSVPIEPIAEVYDRLVTAEALPDIDGHEQVLLLDPMVHIRSFRSRYHLNEAGLANIQRYHRNGHVRIEAIVNYLQKGVDAGTIDVSLAQQAIEMGNGILDGSLVETTAAPQLEALGATTDVVMPDEFTAPTDQLELDKQQVISETVDSLMQDFDDLIDDIDRDVTGTRGLDGEDYVDMYVAWQRLIQPSLAPKTTYKPFLERHNSVSDTAEAVGNFNEFAEQQVGLGNDDFEDFEPMNEEMWANLGKHLEYEWMKTSRRMVRAAALSSNALWFDMAREFYVPRSNRSAFSNFIIDTMDYTEMVSQPEWDGIAVDDQNPAHTIDPAKIFHTTLVNEVQIELGSEEPYLERLEQLKMELEADPGNEEIQRQLNITYQEAELYKMGGGPGMSSDEVLPQEVESIIQDKAEDMAHEIQRSLDFYAATAADSKIDKIAVSGGTAAIPSLVRTIERISGVKTELINPFRNISYDDSKFSPDRIQRWSPIAAISVGLALRRTNER
jgi:hypothetical protein